MDLVDEVVRRNVRVVAHAPFGVDLDGAGRVLVHAPDRVLRHGPDVVVEELPGFIHLGRWVATVDGRVVVESSVELDRFASQVQSVEDWCCERGSKSVSYISCHVKSHTQ